MDSRHAVLVESTQYYFFWEETTSMVSWQSSPGSCLSPNVKFNANALQMISGILFFYFHFRSNQKYVWVWKAWPRTKTCHSMIWSYSISLLIHSWCFRIYEYDILLLFLQMQFHIENKSVILPLLTQHLKNEIRVQ